MNEVRFSTDPVLLRQTYQHQGVEQVRLGEVTAEYHRDFRLYLTTRFRNPHYLPQVTVKVGIFLLHGNPIAAKLYVQ